MRKLFAALLFLAALGTAEGQLTSTPNLNLQLPPYAYPNWNTVVNSNFSKIDTAYGVLANPYQGAWSSTTIYSSGQMVLYNGNVYISLQTPNTNNPPATSGAYWAQLSVSSGGGGGSGTVNRGPPAAVPSYESVTGTTVGANPNLYELNSTMSLAQVNAVFASLNCGTSCGPNYYGTVIIPNGVSQIPFTNSVSAYGNTGTSVADFRVGMQTTPVSTWGTVCDARSVNVVLTSGSTTVYPTNSVIGTPDIGKTLPVVGLVSGVPTAFTPTITGVATATLTSWSATGGVVTFVAPNSFVPGLPFVPYGMNSTNAFNGNQYIVVSASSSQFTFSAPGQANTGSTPDTGALVSSGVTISTAAPFGGAINNVIIGTDNQPMLQSALTALQAGNLVGVLPAGCGMLTSTLQWNGGQSIIGQGSGVTNLYGMPGMDIIATPDAAGLGSVTKQGLLAGYFTLNVNNSIDATKPWNLVTSNGVVHNQMPYYRPLSTQTFNSNVPTAPGWATWFSTYTPAFNGVATVTSGSTTICIPNALGRTPSTVSGNTITFRDTPIAYSGTVTSLTDSGCAAGFSPATISPAMGTGSGYNIAQAEWVSSAGTQTIASAIPAGTVTYPFTLTLANSITPVPYFKGGFGTHGSFKVGSEQYYYQGISSYSGKTINVVGGPATSAGWTIGTATLPMNPCSANANVPYPVTPSINTGDSTPSGANYFPALCVGNAGIAMPQANGNVFVGTGWSFSHIQDIYVNAATNNNANNTAGFYFAGNMAPYNTLIDNIHSVGTTYGFVQGAAGYGMHGVAGVGPTGAGNHITNCSFNAGYPLVLVDFENSGVDTCNNQTTLYDQYAGVAIGSATAIALGYTLDEQTGSVVTNVANSTIKDVTAEPGNGTHSEVPPYAMLDCAFCTYWNDFFEGAGTIIGGTAQIFKGGQMAGLASFPNIIYGAETELDQTTGTNFGNINSNVYGVGSTLDWGTYSRSKVYGGEVGGSGPAIAGLAYARASWDGNSSESFRDGVPQLYANSLGGYISAAELSSGIGVDAAPMSYSALNDAASPSGTSSGCNVTTGGGCFPVYMDGFGGGLALSPTNRISSAVNYKVTAAFQTPAGANSFVFSVQVKSNGGTCNYPLGHTYLSQTIATSANWTTVSYPVNLNDNNALGCLLELGFGNSGSNTLLKVGYVNFQPVPNVEPLQLATFTNGAACPAYSIPGDFIGSDTTNVYMCASGGTVKVLPFNGGGSFTSPMTTLGDTLAQGSSVAVRIAGSTSTQPAFLSETGTGTVSALPSWVSSSGTGSVCLTVGCQMVTPSLGVATATSITMAGPQTGYAGYGTSTYTLGASGQVGTGATTPTCGAVCDSFSGTFSFTTGTGTLAAGTIVTVHVPGTRNGANGTTYNAPNCIATIASSSASGILACTAANSSGTVTLTLSSPYALTASQLNTITYAIWGI